MLGSPFIALQERDGERAEQREKIDSVSCVDFISGGGKKT